MDGLGNPDSGSGQSVAGVKQALARIIRHAVPEHTIHATLARPVGFPRQGTDPATAIVNACNGPEELLHLIERVSELLTSERRPELDPLRSRLAVLMNERSVSDPTPLPRGRDDVDQSESKASLPTSNRALKRHAALLRSLFTRNELHRVVAYTVDLETVDIHWDKPYSDVSMDVVELLDRVGAIEMAWFWRLVTQRPRKAREIIEVSKLYDPDDWL